ncbi:MAG: aminotransferase class V-fold PLP-dependent enzyme, partial [bacterium]
MAWKLNLPIRHNYGYLDVLAMFKAIFMSKSSQKDIFNSVEQKLNKILESDVFLTASGTTAFIHIIKQINNRDKNEIVLPVHLCAKIAISAVRLGLKIKLYDVMAENFSVNYDSLKGQLSNKTLAVLVMHSWGVIQDFSPLNSLKKRYGFSVIEDCCQAFGAKFKGKSVGHQGDFAFFSFSHMKTVSAMGLGCMLLGKNNRNKNQIDIIKKDTFFNIISLSVYIITTHPLIYRLFHKIIKKRAAVYANKRMNDYITLPKLILLNRVIEHWDDI